MDANYDDLALEESIKQHFGKAIQLKKALIHAVPVSPTLEASIFLSQKNQLYVLIKGQSRTTLGDIRKIIYRMGLKPLTFLPPRGEPDFFDRFAREQYRTVFPGLSPTSQEDLHYYKGLTPYSPALVQISEVANGVIHQYDSDSSSKWRPVLRYTYRRIKTI